jgi:hypothetical protein
LTNINYIFIEKRECPSCYKRPHPHPLVFQDAAAIQGDREAIVAEKYLGERWAHSIPFLVERPEKECDICRVVIFAEKCMHCATCNYDECMRCFEARQ